jgi:hypothetical protein
LANLFIRVDALANKTNREHYTVQDKS